MGLVIVGSGAGVGGVARAIDVDRLVMPGPVIAAHERWEGQCNQCHRPLDRAGQDALCLDCHDEQREDRERGVGFHGRSAAVRSAAACRSCHPDHRGRDADVRGLIAEIFDHRETDHPLEGAHRSTPCASCHPPEKSRRDAPGDCVGCHAADDPHGDDLSDDCRECHTPVSWSEARFDHDETRFPLRGAHRPLACTLCHPGPQAAHPPTDCVSCHRPDDAHRGHLGTDCGACHGADRWASTSFDHGRETGFALRGGHADLACVACHETAPKPGGTPTDCVSCHRSEDVHAGRNGTECGTCHGVDGWGEVLFDHARDAGFRLTGAHADLRCARCHGDRLEGLPASPACIDCHRTDDVHAGSLTAACDTCHGDRSWSHPIVFEHDIARFPLLGMHAAASCEQCHTSRAFDRADPSCRACHAVEDTHRGTLGDDCGRCHGPNGWPLWEFDHGAETSFALHGSHAELACSACHGGSAPRASATSNRCVFCHAADDAHFGGFGDRCETCHTDRLWNEIQPLR